MDQQKIAISATFFSIFTNFILSIVKYVAGTLGNSYALIADAIESINDTLASLLVLLGLKYANKPADENHPYGHGRIEPLITFFVVGILILSAVIIAYHSIINIQTPHELPNAWTLLVLGVIIIYKEIAYQIIIRKSVQANSSSLRADAWHHRSDALTSVAAFIGITVALVLGKGYEAADDWAALLASVFILWNSYKIFRPALGEMMDEHFYDDLVLEIRRISKTVDGVVDTEKCFIRKSGLKYLVELHAIVNGEISVRKGHEIAHLLSDTLISVIPEIKQVMVHIEPNDSNSQT